tara:strand:+ start:325 stop:519 length:195 start_codon:yes stop_codon:yes gene_type:complete
MLAKLKMERGMELAVFVIKLMVYTRENSLMACTMVSEGSFKTIPYTMKDSGSLAKNMVLAQTFI